MQEKSNVYENSVDVNVENRSRNEDASKQSSNVGEDRRTETSSASADYKNETNARPSGDKDCNSDDGFIRYEPDHFSNPDASQQSNRTGRYNDSKFNFNRDRDNRRDRGRDNRRDGRRSDNGPFRRDDSNYGRSENSFGQKWNSNRNRNNGPGGRKFSERDNGYGFRDRNESGSNFSNRSSCSSSTTNLRDDADTKNDRYDRNDRRHDERLIDDVSSNDARVRDEKFKESTYERSKIINNDVNTVENGNENGVDSEDVGRKSNESIAIISEQSELNDSSFSSSKSRKRDKKKKHQEKRDIDVTDKDHERQKNQKDEKKKSVGEFCFCNDFQMRANKVSGMKLIDFIHCR